MSDTNSQNITLSDTNANYHTYRIDWTPDAITWSVDGQVGRTKNKKDTWNATSNRWDFPQTPARVQLSLWPGGLASNGQGTIDWAGGLVDWNSADIQNNGYYYASFKSISINCYNATSGAGTNSGKSYTYNSVVGTNNTVVDGTEDTVLASFLGTGTDMDAGASTASGSASVPSSTAETIPGLSGGGVGTNQHSNGDSDTSSVASASGSTATGSSSSSGFSQGGSSSKSGADKFAAQERVLGGSIFAGIVAVVAMMAL